MGLHDLLLAQLAALNQALLGGLATGAGLEKARRAIIQDIINT